MVVEEVSVLNRSLAELNMLSWLKLHLTLRHLNCGEVALAWDRRSSSPRVPLAKFKKRLEDVRVRLLSPSTEPSLLIRRSSNGSRQGEQQTRL